MYLVIFFLNTVFNQAAHREHTVIRLCVEQCSVQLRGLSVIIFSRGLSVVVVSNSLSVAVCVLSVLSNILWLCSVSGLSLLQISFKGRMHCQTLVGLCYHITHALTEWQCHLKEMDSSRFRPTDWQALWVVSIKGATKSPTGERENVKCGHI